uniref:Putative glycosyltransferase n=1 Tax=viral metagenome TaxID=1070528 RepID=A0A6M3LWN1_9ZZZZ
MEYLRREPKPGDPKHTLAINLKHALPKIKGDKIIIIEDDEYYAPTYIEEMSRHLENHKVVGIMHSKYYHLPSGGYVQMGNSQHASLAQTAFKGSFMPELSRFIEIGMIKDWLDCQIWAALKTSRHPRPTNMLTPRSLRIIQNKIAASKNGQSFLFVDSDKPLYLGIKGLPGRPGIGQGHNVGMYRTRDSATRDILKSWVPEDYQIYIDVINGKLTENNYREYFGW